MFCEAATGRQLERVATRVSAGIVRPEFGKRKTADGIGTAPGNGGFQSTNHQAINWGKYGSN